MQRIHVPVYFNTPETTHSETLGINVPNNQLVIREVFLFTDKLVAFYPRVIDGAISGTTIETVVGRYHSPLTSDGLDELLTCKETDEFVSDLKNMGFKGAEDLIPPNFDDEINNMLMPNDRPRKDPED